MSVKSTQYISRAECICKITELVATCSQINNERLADVLEILDDAACGGESFRNYAVTDDGAVVNFTWNKS